jgi:RHS repeat-associated protein
MEDPGTGLVYMQQRYYDPAIARFLSVDPVGPLADPTNHFGRYHYANNNPYKYRDPDGRFADLILDVGFIAYSTYTLINEPSLINAAALGADVVGAAVPFATGLGAAVRAGAHATDVARAADAAGDAAKVMRGPSPKVNAGQQGKHQPGHNNYQPGRSVLKADPSELGRHAGTGQQVGKIEVGLPGSKERVDFGQAIGTHVDKAGNVSETTVGIIHYGKEGMHIVPARPLK